MSESAEEDYGVPIPGAVLPKEQWARTAIKRLPPPGFLDWKEIFCREAPVVLDLGCGNGRFVISSALARPQLDHIGIDILPVVIRYATRRANQRGLTNVRFAVVDALQLLSRLVEPASVAEIHCYHPQPYFDPQQVHRRLITPEFLVLVHRSLVPGGLFYIQTDNPGYWQYLRQVLPVFFEFQERSGPWPDAPKGRTRRE